MIDKDGNFRSKQPVFDETEPIEPVVAGGQTLMLSPAEVKDRKEVLMEVPAYFSRLLEESPHTDLELLKSIKSDLESHGNEAPGQADPEARGTDTVRSAYLNTPAVLYLLEEESRADREHTTYRLQYVLPSTSVNYNKSTRREEVLFQGSIAKRRVIFMDGEVVEKHLTTGDIEDILEELFSPEFVSHEDVAARLNELESAKKQPQKPLRGILRVFRGKH